MTIKCHLKTLVIAIFSSLRCASALNAVLAVAHNPSVCQLQVETDEQIELVFGTQPFLYLSYILVCYKEIPVLPKLRVLPSGT